MIDLRTAYYVELGVGLTHSIIGLAMFLLRREKYPIRARNKPLVTLAVITFTLSTYGSFYLSDPPTFCSWVDAISLSFSLVLMNIILVRLFRIWFLFSIAHEQMSLHNATDWEIGVIARTNDFGKAHRKLRFTDRRKYISNRWLFGGFLSLTLIQMVIHFSNFAVFRQSSDVDIYDPQCLSTAIRAVLYGFVGIMIVCLVVVSCIVRKQRDNYHIRQEIAMFLVFTVVASAVSVPTDGLQQRVLMWFPIQLNLATMLWYPLFLSYRAERKQHKLRKELVDATAKTNDVAEPATENPRRVSIMSTRLLQVLLNDEYIDARRSFQRFLVREFAVENLLFFKATRNFEMTQNLSDEQVGAAALQLYMEFLISGAPYQVNIDSQIHAQIDADLASCFEGFERVKYAYTSGAALIPGVSVDAEGATIPSMEREAARRVSTHILKDQEVPSAPSSPRPSAAAHKRTLSNGECEIEIPTIKKRVRQDIYKNAHDSILILLENDCYIRWRSEYISE